MVYLLRKRVHPNPKNLGKQSNNFCFRIEEVLTISHKADGGPD